MTQNCETASSPDTACNRDCSLPSILYKYFSSARLDVLAERSVRFTQPGDFNDPFELRPRIQAAAHEHEVRTHVENNFDRLIDQELNKYGALVPPELLDAVRAAAHDQKFLVPGLYRLLEPGVLNTRLSLSMASSTKASAFYASVKLETRFSCGVITQTITTDSCWGLIRNTHSSRSAGATKTNLDSYVGWTISATVRT